MFACVLCAGPLISGEPVSVALVCPGRCVCAFKRVCVFVCVCVCVGVCVGVCACVFCVLLRVNMCRSVRA